ncbi:uncharacterized protein KD926_009132 [Aspergillus affinis]|uniref:uncharacterized protein n=1 Tax=Aspergillus affinis TaxID=1070780 RepID=UPI0022FEB243|nr:uncharacterized protein KD926_009132 [Aspergillus affinis]KAI9039789.1 hypothetical protein KD926_009132 [Aspergillus affinis]
MCTLVAEKRAADSQFLTLTRVIENPGNTLFDINNRQAGSISSELKSYCSLVERIFCEIGAIQSSLEQNQCRRFRHGILKLHAEEVTHSRGHRLCLCRPLLKTMGKSSSSGTHVKSDRAIADATSAGDNDDSNDAQHSPIEAPKVNDMPATPAENPRKEYLLQIIGHGNSVLLSHLGPNRPDIAAFERNCPSLGEIIPATFEREQQHSDETVAKSALYLLSDKAPSLKIPPQLPIPKILPNEPEASTERPSKRARTVQEEDPVD